jgi:hypothetical protein
MTEYLFGSTLRLDNTFKDLDDALYDPTTLSLSITDPEGTVKKTVTYAANEIKRTSVGVFYYDYDIPATGVSGYWVASWDANITLQTDISEIQFYVLYVSILDVQSSLMASVDVTMSDDTLRNLIRYAGAEVDTITGRSFYDKTERTEWFDTLTPNPATVIDRLFLMHLPMQSIVSLEGYDTDNDLIKTYTTDEYYTDSNGIITLLRDEFPHSKHSIKVVYYSGYQACPMNISNLTNIIAQIKLLRHYMQAQDDQMTSFTMDGIGSVTLGEVYTVSNILIQQLEREKKDLIKTIGNLKCDVFVL